MACRRWLNGSGCKRKRRAGAAEADEGDDKGEASAVQTTMRPIEEERRKAMSRKMMREKDRERKLEEFGLRKNFQIFIELVILPGWYRGAPRVQGCLSHMT